MTGVVRSCQGLAGVGRGCLESGCQGLSVVDTSRQGLPGVARSSKEVVRRCQGLLGSVAEGVWVCQELQGVVRTYQELQEVVRSCQYMLGLPGVFSICQELTEVARMCQELSGSVAEGVRMCHELP